jgi:LssY C-terminus
MSRRVAVLGLLLCPVLALAQFRLSNNSTPTPKPQPQSQPQTASPSSTGGKQLDVSASSGWTDTGIELHPGDRVTITGTGSLQFQASGVTGPNGLERTWRDVMQSLPLNSAGRGALIARIGNSPAVVPFLVGAQKEFTVTNPGRLFLGVNLASDESLNGTYKADVHITPAANVTQAKAPELKFDAALLDKIPRRVADSAGNPGDMVNFILIGSQQQMLDAFAKAGYVQVDKTTGEAVAHAILSTIAKQSYLEMPMSELYLFGRSQDFGMARAEPISVVQTRHHLRVWKAPFQFDGQDVWVGAATHDLGFEKDQRDGSVTHHIDPNVDAERTFVEQSLTDGGDVAATTLVTPKDPVKDAKTATGGSFHSDGRIVVMQLRPA